MSRFRFGRTPVPSAPPPPKPYMNTLQLGTAWSLPIPSSPRLWLTGCEIIHRSRKWREPGSSLPTWRLSPTHRMRFSSGARDRSPRPLWMGWELVIMNLVCAPGGKAFWKERGYMFGEEFRRYVESDLMKREPHPDAKPMGAFPIGQSAT